MITIVAGVQGSGRTTLSLNIAVTAAYDKHNVLAIDTSRDGALLAALASREGTPIAAAQYVAEKSFLQQVRLARFRYEDVVIDVSNNELLPCALQLADLVLIPFQDRSALAEINILLGEVKAQRSGQIIALAFPWMSHACEYGVVMEPPLENIDCLASSVGFHKAFGKASSSGYSVLELSYIEPNASTEFHLLISEITQRVQAVKQTRRHLAKVYSDTKLMGHQAVIRVPFSYERLIKLEAWASGQNMDRVEALWLLVDNLE
ncbi:MAG: hypothetical protein K2P67_09025 [Gallionellaceae bacterium]|nr:hypothetical protein [Gallionellaceae bacterium]